MKKKKPDPGPDDDEGKGWIEHLFGKKRNKKTVGEILAGGSDKGQDLADEIIDAWDVPLDPEEQEMVREEVEAAIREKKRQKARKLARKKLEKKRGRSLEDMKLAGGDDGRVGDSEVREMSDKMVGKDGEDLGSGLL